MTEISEALKKLRKEAKKRNFNQRLDLIVNLRGIDTKKPENRINEIFELPYGSGKEAKIVVFSDEVSDEIKNIINVEVLNTKDVENLAKNKRECKKLAKNFDFFISDQKILPFVTKNLGKFLAPRGKTPKPIVGDLKKMIESLKKSVRIRIKDAPTIQIPVGSENMKDEEIEKNIQEVLKFISEKLPKKKNNIKEALIKFTMSKPVKVEVKL
ncbi:MAG: 50S ribosomal protein L1 [Candidatus Aenigmarchaeota archaeon]|nr:50S ribosomal protein L1 [Candidatus Aenigmarchaeota archaeon]MCX8190764.1 50S ribosomal protein L1 [Candidatus Aenigmarchaeota archaeon]MDW8160011.1 50S ribosomal protein L1 [Candidatus Aenigmarchaeota archaeon]